VQNGPTGTLPVTPLDPTPPQISNDPTFTAVAEGLLDNLDIVGDGYEDIESAATLSAAQVDAAGVAQDEVLDAILELLNDVSAQQPIEDDFTTFASDAGGIDNLVAGVDPTQLPTLSPIPLVDPGGNGTITFGGSPSTGGVPTAGSPAYVLQVPLPRSGAYISAPGGAQLSGPNPPFTGLQGFQQVPNPAGGTQWVALVGINPAADGTFTATLTYTVVVSITGIQGQMNVSLPFSVVVSG